MLTSFALYGMISCQKAGLATEGGCAATQRAVLGDRQGVSEHDKSSPEEEAQEQE